MSCNDCKEEKKSDCPCGTFTAADQRRLERWRRCEPYCDNGGCIERPRPAPCDTGKCSIGGAEVELDYTNPLGTMTRVMVRQGLLVPCVDATGAKGWAFPGGPCFVTEADCLCATTFGPHFNAEVRRSDISPTAGADIVKTYGGFETLELTLVASTSTLTPFEALGGGWSLISLGQYGAPTLADYWYIGLSHMVCVHEVELFTLDAGGLEVPIALTGIAAGGGRAACGDGRGPDPAPFDGDFGDAPAAPEGHFAYVLDNPTTGEADGMDITPARCRCVKPICVYTPAGGGEHFYLKTADALPVGARARVKVSRCKWLEPVDFCIGAIGSRLVRQYPRARFVGPAGFLPGMP